MVPCSRPIWLAGVVAGSFGRHSAIRWLPLADPPRQRRQGAGAHAPLEHGIGHAVGLHEHDARYVGVVEHDVLAARAAEQGRGGGVVGAGGGDPDEEGRDRGHDPGRDQRPPDRRRRCSPCGRYRTSQIASAWPNRPTRRAPTQPIQTAPSTRKTRSTAPKIATSTATRKACSSPCTSKPGSTHEAITRPRVAPTRPRRARPRSPQRRRRPRGFAGAGRPMRRR